MLQPDPSPAALHDIFLELHEFLEGHDPDPTFACRATCQAFADEWSAAALDYARPTLRDVIEVVHILRRLLSVLALPPLDADVVHGTAAGVSSLLGLVTKARKGTRFVLTEHGVFVREAFIAQASPLVSSAVRHVLGRFAVATAMAAFFAADEVLPVAEFNRRWELALATDPAKIRVVYNGVDPQSHQPTSYPKGPPEVRLGRRIDPLKDLKTLIRTAAIVREERPDVLVDLYGPVPNGNERYYDKLLALRAELGLEETVRFLGPTSDVAAAYASGHIALVTSISEGFPFAVVEAMMNGRPVVATGIGEHPEGARRHGPHRRGPQPRPGRARLPRTTPRPRQRRAPRRSCAITGAGQLHDGALPLLLPPDLREGAGMTPLIEAAGHTAVRIEDAAPVTALTPFDPDHEALWETATDRSSWRRSSRATA